MSNLRFDNKDYLKLADYLNHVESSEVNEHASNFIAFNLLSYFDRDINELFFNFSGYCDGDSLMLEDVRKMVKEKFSRELLRQLNGAEI